MPRMHVLQAKEGEGRMSYCDDCVHQRVCKYIKQVKEYEAKAPEVSTVIGPVISYSIRCTEKNREEDYQQR